MRAPLRVAIALAAAVAGAGCASKLPVARGADAPAERPVPLRAEAKEQLPQAIAPRVFPPIPPADAAAAEVPAGYRVEVVVRDLEYPTSVEFDDAGNLYIALAGFSYGDPVAPARIYRVSPSGRFALVADGLRGPVNDLLWHGGALYISHFGTISALEKGAVRDLVTDLPASFDHQNNQLTAGPDGRIYFGMGTVTNSGVVGLDNVSPFLWLLFYPDLHDVSPYDIELENVGYATPDPLTVLANQGELTSLTAAAKKLVSSGEPLIVETGAFQPFGKKADRVKGAVKANGTILRMQPDGSELEVYAWGLRNPYGVRWAPDGHLYAADNGYDERGSRPIANAPDNVFRIREGGWYGFPDFAGGEPVTDEKFHSSRGPAPKFLLKDHPPVEKPVHQRPPHAGVTKMDFAPMGPFGFEGQMFLGEVGAGGPVNLPGQVDAGYMVSRIDLASGVAEPFFRLRREAYGPEGYEHAVTPGPRRPVDVVFSPDGSTLYVVDFGALVAFPAGAGPLAHPYPGSGVVWRIFREGTTPQGPPADLSPLPPRE